MHSYFIAIRNTCVTQFKSGGQVGIYDASNTEESRRDYLYERLVQHKVQV